ncbi:hypothetical protein V6Z12_D08G301700 [Gossypium hirsutum]
MHSKKKASILPPFSNLSFTLSHFFFNNPRFQPPSPQY